MSAQSRAPARSARSADRADPSLSAPARTLSSQRAGNAAAQDLSSRRAAPDTRASTAGYRPTSSDVLRSLGSDSSGVDSSSVGVDSPSVGVDSPGVDSPASGIGGSVGGSSSSTCSSTAPVTAAVDPALSAYIVQSCPGLTDAEATSLLSAPETAVRSLTFGAHLSAIPAWLNLLKYVEVTLANAAVSDGPVSGTPVIGAPVVSAPVSDVFGFDTPVSDTPVSDTPALSLLDSPALAPEGDLIPGIDPATHEARHQNAALALRLTTARQRLADPAALTGAECDTLIALANADATLANAQAVLAALYGDRAEEAADHLYNYESKKSSVDKAEILYSRIRPAGIQSEDVDEAVAAYSLPIRITLGGEQRTLQVQTPYHISTRLADKAKKTPSGASATALAIGTLPGSTPEQTSAAAQTAWAKGSPDETQMTLQAAVDADLKGVKTRAITAYNAVILSKSYKEEALTFKEALTAASDAITQWMGEENIGVDCSGFTFSTVQSADTEAATAWSTRNPNISTQRLATDHSNVALQTNDANAVPIPVSAAQSGDLAATKSSSHIGMVRDNEATTFATALAAISDEKIRAASRTSALRADTRLTDTSPVYVVQIAHSIDANGPDNSTDIPGPHVGTYAYNHKGASIWVEDVKNGAFSKFFRNKVKPVN